MKILFYCCEFAPEGKTGAIRPSKLAKYFKKFGADINVLTKEVNKPIYNDLLADLIGIEIERVKIRKLLPINDDGFWFSIYSIMPMIRYISKNRPDYIFISVPVFLPIIVVYFISVFYGVKFIIDYRDLWHGDPYPPKSFKDKFLRSIAKYIEPWCMRSSYATIFVSEKMKQDQESIYGVIKNSGVITTGFDVDDLASISKEICSKYLTPGYRYYSHVGMLDWDMNIDLIIKLIRKNKNYIVKNKIKFIFVGGKNDLIKPAFNDQDIYEVCEFIDTVDKKSALSITKQSSGVIILGSSSGQRLNRKVFESVACNDNIFYFGNRYSPTADVLYKSNNNFIYDSDDDFDSVDCGFFDFINMSNNRVEIPDELGLFLKENISKIYYNLLVKGL